MPKKSTVASEKHENQIVIRFDAEALARIEKHVDRLKKSAQGISITRAGAIRSLVLTRLDQIEAQEGKP